MRIYDETVTTKSWAEEDRPREKLLKLGRRSLSNAELIAILIQSGSTNETSVDLAKRILRKTRNDLGLLAQLTVKELTDFRGIGSAKAIAIIAALELGRRSREAKSPEISKMAGSRDVYLHMARYFADLSHEEFRILLLARSNRFLSHHLISVGGQSGTVVDPKIVFRTAIEHKAASLVLMHNHPSGNPSPSHSDIKLTKQLIAAAASLDIAVLDHLIFVNNGYYSFADEGLI